MSRHCARPGCNAPAAAAFNFDGLRRIVWLNPIVDTRDRSAGDLCAPHADRLTPPLHWELRDLRSTSARPDRPTRPARPMTEMETEPESPLLARAFRAAG
jgi:hypothetical protein